MTDTRVADRRFMAQALQLAERGLYTTDPNPRVGCVLVKDDRVIGEGWHRVAGEAHAEVAALASATEDPSGATAYVTLEPCCTEGLTGPCTRALIDAGIERAVVAMRDPNPDISGRGFAELEQAGIEVTTPLLEEAAARLNPGFIKRHVHGVPFVRCKLAMSLDGRTALANGRSRWVSGPDARADTQKLRARGSAIVTGIDTVVVDNPQMTLRAGELRVDEVELALANPPIRVVLDSHLRMPLDANILRAPGRVMIFTRAADNAAVEALEHKGVTVIRQSGDGARIDLPQMLTSLAELECNEVLVEAGPTLAGAFIEGGLVDELVIYVAAKLFGDPARPLIRLPEFTTMEQTIELDFREIRQVGDNIRITATVNSR